MKLSPTRTRWAKERRGLVAPPLPLMSILHTETWHDGRLIADVIHCARQKWCMADTHHPDCPIATT